MEIPSEYDFNQLFAEARVRINKASVDAYARGVADAYGWPPPPHMRGLVIGGLLELVRMHTEHHRGH